MSLDTGKLLQLQAEALAAKAFWLLCHNGEPLVLVYRPHMMWSDVWEADAPLPRGMVRTDLLLKGEKTQTQMAVQIEAKLRVLELLPR